MVVECIFERSDIGNLLFEYRLFCSQITKPLFEHTFQEGEVGLSP